MKKWIVWLLVLCLADILLTYIGLRIGLTEANILGYRMGFWPFSVFKMALVGIWAILLWRREDVRKVKTKKPSWFKRYIYGVSLDWIVRGEVVAFGLVVVWNCYLITTHA